MSLLHPFLHKFASYLWYIYICPKRTYSCIKRMRGQQVHLRERIPNAMFVTLSTYFYAGARMLNHSHKDVVYTNADKRRLIFKQSSVQSVFHIFSRRYHIE
jgi:hypothetical protein